MTDKAGLQPPQQVMNAEALHKVGVGAGGSWGLFQACQDAWRRQR